MVTRSLGSPTPAAETEREREDLQRQVIRLLDDVEGAARGNSDTMEAGR
ncbi:MAG UNVERIFIED_CONTAM: hypothetical protein LVR29_16030 [Microcystis novacekii LVE1205-3]